MRSQLGQQTITTHVLPNIPRSKGNKKMKFDQLIKYSKNKKLFFKNYAENEEGILVPDFFLFFIKTIYEVKTSGLQVIFNIFRQPTSWHTIKTNYIKIQAIDPEIC